MKGNKMRKFLCVFILLTVLTCVLSSCDLPFLSGEETTAQTFEQTTETILEETFSSTWGLDYQVNEDGVTCAIVGIGTCTDSNVYIGGYIDGYKITAIADRAFWSCESLVNIKIDDSVAIIGNEAFWKCENLISITLGDSVTTIQNHVFEYCRNLTRVIIGDSVTTIGYCAFSYCDNLTSAIFVNPNGWWCSQEEKATSGKTISVKDLSNFANAANYLKSPECYCWYYWYRTK